MRSAVPQPFQFQWDLWDQYHHHHIIKSWTYMPPCHHHSSFSHPRLTSPRPAPPRVSSAPPSRIYVAQQATRGNLLLWGAKINSLTEKGQIWRLATSSLLHANIGHLMVWFESVGFKFLNEESLFLCLNKRICHFRVDCYPLHCIGPTVENIGGPRRFLGVYFTWFISSAATSYWFCEAPAVGASGAIFGLVIGLMSKGIDNWGHLGGLLGGAAISWLLGPGWKYESIASDGRRIYSD